MTDIDIHTAAQFLQREALLLDQRNWQDWLDLYDPDCFFWVPTWRDEDHLIEDPKKEISFIYATARRTLEERVRRIEQGKSITTSPMVRTCHVLGFPVWSASTDGEDDAWVTPWVNHIYDPRTCESIQLFGHYRHQLARNEDNIRIKSKIVSLVNDRIPTVLDIYSV